MEDDYEQVSVRIYKRDWRAILRMQAAAAESRRKPSQAEIVRDAMKLLEEAQ